jgi:hypothetical protein
MLSAYLNGIRIPEEFAKAFMNSVGQLNETCLHCGGSVIEIKSVKINSDSNPLFRVWCSTCGTGWEVCHDLPRPWYHDLVRSLEIRAQRIL